MTIKFFKFMLVFGLAQNICDLAFAGVHGIPRFAFEGGGQQNRNLFRVAIIGSKDDRVPLSEIDGKWITAQEKQWLRGVTGYFVRADGLNLSAALVGSPNIVLTALHGLVDHEGAFNPGLLKPHFQSFNTSQAVALDFTSGSFALGSADVNQFPGKDFAVVRLKAPSRGLRPIPLLPASEILQAGQEVISIAIPKQEGMTRSIPWNEPAAQICHIHRVYLANPSRGTLYYTDCDIGGGGSGGILLVRWKGQLAAAGMAYASATAVGKSERDFQPFSLDEKTANFTKAIAVTGEVRSAMEALTQELFRLP
jgi:hypothetical protein